LSSNSQDHDIDLLEVNFRNRIAREIVRGFSSSAFTLAEVWSQVQAALADTPRLIRKIAQLRAELAATRLDRANLAAAARSTIAAHREGERDPLSYIRDEIEAQGFTNEGRGR
jgi:ABC-type transporter Mla subunit MlaD